MMVSFDEERYYGMMTESRNFEHYTQSAESAINVNVQ
jgi:hypothetical protein